MTRSTVGIALALLFLSVTPVSFATGTVDTLLDVGELHMRHRDYQSAFNYFDRAVKQDPNEVHAHIYRQEAVKRGELKVDLFPEYRKRWESAPTDALAVYLYSRFLEADAALRTLSKVKEDTFYSHIRRARVLRQLGKPGEANSEMNAAQAKCPRDPRAYGLVAGYWEDTRRFQDALRYFDMALAIRPDRIEAMVGKGNVLRLMGKTEEALAVLTKAEKDDPEDPEIPYRLGLAHYEAGEWEKAISAFKRSLGHDRKDVPTLLAIGDTYLAQDQPGEAEDWYSKALELSPGRIDTLRRLGFCLDLQDRRDEALEAYEKVKEIDPLNAPVRTAIGWILLRKGKNDKALKEFRQAADMDQNDVTPLFLIGYTYDLMGRYGEAADAYELVIKRDPEYARAYNNLGLDQGMLGKTSRALKNFKKAVALDPENINFSLNLAGAYYDTKKYKDALDVYSEVTVQDPEEISGWTGSARCMNHLRRFPEAAEAYEKALELDPEDEELHLTVAILYQEKVKNYQAALDHYEAFVKLGGDHPSVESWMEECKKKLK